MGTAFVTGSSKMFFEEVPTPLTHHAAPEDKPAPSQLLQHVRQPAQALAHNRGGEGPNPNSWEEKKENSNAPQNKSIICFIKSDI